MTNQSLILIIPSVSLLCWRRLGVTETQESGIPTIITKNCDLTQLRGSSRAGAVRTPSVPSGIGADPRRGIPPNV